MSKIIKYFLAITGGFIIALIVSSCSNKKIEQDEKETIRLNLWHIWPEEYTPQNNAISNVLNAWHKENPHSQIKVYSVESESYKVKIRTAIATNNAPDIFYSWGAGFAEPLIKSGKILKMDNYLAENTFRDLENGSLDYLTYNKNIYGLPWSKWVGTFFCNTELFERYNLSLPETFEDLVYVVKEFRNHGIVPMAVGGKDLWPGMFYYNILAIRTAGVYKTTQALNNQTSFYDPDFIKAATLLKTLIDEEAFGTDFFGLSRDESEVPFFAGEIPMYYNGSWVSGRVQAEDSPVNNKIKIIPFPYIKGYEKNRDELLGGANEGFFVCASTPYKKECVKAVEFISRNLSEEFLKEKVGSLPVWNFNIDEQLLNPLYAQNLELTKDAKQYMLSWDTFLMASNAEIHKQLVGKIFLKEISPEDFCSEMDKILSKTHN